MSERVPSERASKRVSRRGGAENDGGSPPWQNCTCKRMRCGSKAHGAREGTLCLTTHSQPEAVVFVVGDVSELWPFLGPKSTLSLATLMSARAGAAPSRTDEGGSKAKHRQ